MARKASVPVKVKGRYEQIRAILNAAARDGASDYGGAGAFWDAGVPALVAARVHGVQMIAPEMAASCCDRESRSARSGLIRGLRGEPPFDGSRFPPLPWGGTRLSDDNIALIAGWIDDGCPADDAIHTLDFGPLEAKGGKVEHVSVAVIADRDEFAPGPCAHAYREGEPRQRQNIDCLTEPQLASLRAAFRATYDLDDKVEDRRNFNNQALIHQNHCQHGWERFLPWHRAYVYEFEQNLHDVHRDVVALPYWDWTMPHYRPDDPTKGAIIPQAFKAFLGAEQVEPLVAALQPRPTRAQVEAFKALAAGPTFFTSQQDFFCHVIDVIGYKDVTPSPTDANRQRMIDALLASNALWYPLRYPAEYAGGKTINEAIHYHYPTADDMAQILSLRNFRDFGGGSVYDAAFGFLDQNPHNTMHIWTGGMNPSLDGNGTLRPAYVCGKAPAPAAAPTPPPAARRNATTRVADRRFHRREDLYSQPGFGDMFSNLTASYDPIFWPIHVNVDRTWWEWQTHHPNGLPTDLDAVLSPWSYTVRDTLEIAPFGYEYVRSTVFMPVGMEAPITRFVSKPLQIDKAVRSFRKAEVRLHWVPQLLRSCFVRAFVNQPGANASTSVRDNPHYAGYLAIFGHGECYGGPGHCDVPPPRPRSFDQRPRNHNTPRNHRIDVTEAAKRALANGDTLQITLVVVGVDYREERDLLKLDGVSLNFLD